MVKNKGNVEIYAFLAMDIPLGQTEGDPIELYAFDSSSSWTPVDNAIDVKIEGTDFHRYIFAYINGDGLMPLEGHDATTEPLFGSSDGGYVMVSDNLGDVESIFYSSIRFNAYGIACNRFDEPPSVDDAWAKIEASINIMW